MAASPKVTVRSLPPPISSGKRGVTWQYLDQVEGGVEVELPQVKARFLNWGQAKALYLQLQEALTMATRA